LALSGQSLKCVLLHIPIKGGDTNSGRNGIGENDLAAHSETVSQNSEEIAISSESQDIEERIRDTLSVDESVVMQQSERVPVAGADDESERESAERIRMLAADKQLKYVKGLVDNRDDASITELKNLMVFDDEAVRHTAIDTLIKIMDQQTGHYDAIEAALTDSAVFMDERQMARFTKISSRVGK